MRPFRRIARGGAVLRGFALLIHRRTEHLPPLPFIAALVVAVLLLVASTEVRPGSDARISKVEELSLPDDSSFAEQLFNEEVTDIDAVEYGFGVVTDDDGRERISVGAVLRNPHDADVMIGMVRVMATNDSGVRSTVEEIYAGLIPAGAERLLGTVLLGRPDDIDAEVDELELEVTGSVLWEADQLDEEFARLLLSYPSDPANVETALVRVEPLVEPEGYRVRYEVEVTGDDLSLPTSLNVDLIFRDSEGRIMGGMPARGDPFQPDATFDPQHYAPPGVHLQQLDLPAPWVPVGADLSRVEVGPGV